MVGEKYMNNIFKCYGGDFDITISYYQGNKLVETKQDCSQAKDIIDIRNMRYIPNMDGKENFRILT